jgi:hypothetical protein
MQPTPTSMKKQRVSTPVLDSFLPVPASVYTPFTSLFPAQQLQALSGMPLLSASCCCSSSSFASVLRRSRKDHAPSTHRGAQHRRAAAPTPPRACALGRLPARLAARGRSHARARRGSRPCTPRVTPALAARSRSSGAACGWPRGGCRQARSVSGGAGKP